MPKQKIMLKLLERGQLGEYYAVFLEAKENGELGNNITPPKSMASLLKDYAEHKPDYFLIKSQGPKNPGNKETIGAIGASYNARIKEGTIFNQFVKAKYRGRGIGTEVANEVEKHLAKKGAKTISMSIKWSFFRQMRWALKAGYLPSLFLPIKIFDGKIFVRLRKTIK